MRNWKARLGEIGNVETFDYDYIREGRKRPDRLPQLIAAHREALSKAKEQHPSERTILAGKSMGGRIGCHVSLEEKVDGLICLGYPLCAMGDQAKLRDEITPPLRIARYEPRYLNISCECFKVAIPSVVLHDSP